MNGHFFLFSLKNESIDTNEDDNGDYYLEENDDDDDDVIQGNCMNTFFSSYIFDNDLNLIWFSLPRFIYHHHYRPHHHHRSPQMVSIDEIIDQHETNVMLMLIFFNANIVVDI